jgi:hypothetical protein
MWWGTSTSTNLVEGLRAEDEQANAPTCGVEDDWSTPSTKLVGDDHFAALRTSTLQVGPCARASRPSIVSRVASKASASAT